MTEPTDLIEQLRLQVRSGLANEEAMKFQVLQPILQDIGGWKTYDSSEVAFEHPVGGGQAGGRVDIALLDSSQTHQKRIVALIEAKAPREDLSKHTDQVLRYAFHEGCDICVLTNGVEWWLFLPRERGTFLSRRFTTLHLNETPAEQLVEDFKIFLGKKSLTSGQAIEQAKRVLKARQRKALLKRKIPEIWQNMQNEPDDELIELIVKRVYERIDLRPDQSQVIAMLHDKRVPKTAPQTSTTPRPAYLSEPSYTPQTDKSQDSTKPQRKRYYLKPIRIRIFNQEYPVKHWKTVFEKVATVLYKLHPHEYDRTVQNLWSHRKNAIYNFRTYSMSIRIAPDSQSIRSPFCPTGAQIWISLDQTGLSLCERIGQFMEALGHNPNDLEHQVVLRQRKQSATDDTSEDTSYNDAKADIENRWINNTEVIEILKSLQHGTLTHISAPSPPPQSSTHDIHTHKRPLHTTRHQHTTLESETIPQTGTTLEPVQPSELGNTPQTDTYQDSTKPQRKRYYLKPSRIRIFNQEYPVKHWKTVFEKVATVLYKLHPHEYDQTMQNLWRVGRFKTAIASDPLSIRDPFRPEGAQIWISLNKSATSLCENIGQFMKALGHSQNNLECQVKLMQRKHFASDDTLEEDQDNLKAEIENRWINNTELMKLLKFIYKN